MIPVGNPTRDLHPTAWWHLRQENKRRLRVVPISAGWSQKDYAAIRKEVAKIRKAK